MNEINNKYTVCPKCNYICKAEDTFCSRCGCNLKETKISEYFGNNTSKYCPKCGKECAIDQNFCSDCGYSFAEKDKQEENKDKFFINKFTLLLTIMIIFGCFTYLMMKMIGSVPNEKVEVHPNLEEQYSSIKALSCHEKEVKDTALQIFKENDYYYKYLAPESIANVSFKFPSMNSYNSESDKYYCSATIFVKAAQGGFKPINNDPDNHYLEKISEEEDGVKKKYTRYECEINYASQISQDKVYVTATACGNGEDFNNKGNFSYNVERPQVQQLYPETQEEQPEQEVQQEQEEQPVSEEQTVEQPQQEEPQPENTDTQTSTSEE